MPALHSVALPPRARRIATLALLGLAYFAVARVSVANFGVNTPIWFANAIAVVYLLLRPSREWPAVIATVAIADMAAVHDGGNSPIVLLAMADMMEIILSATLLRRLGGAEAMLTKVTGLGRFILVALSVPVLSAALGAGTLAVSTGAAFAEEFRQWYSAAALGMLIVCPILLVWLTPEIRGNPEKDEKVIAIVLATGFGAVVSFVTAQDQPAFLVATFPAFLMLVWRSGLWGASVGSIIVLAIGLWRTFSQEGAFVALEGAGGSLQREVEALQIYLGALILSGLPLAVVLTDQRRLARELERVADARGEFLAAMSHEIRTPMTGVLGMVDLLEAEQPSERQMLFLKSIRSSGRHLLSVINDVLDFSRIETGRIDLEQIDFSLPLLLEEVQGLLQPLARERGIKLGVGLAERSPPVVKGDPTRLTQILLNLAGNAIKFTPEGSVLIIGMHRPEAPGHRFRFEVRDTGIGIAADKLPHIFTAFTQADRSTSRFYGGSGLGLAISKRLVGAMGGEIGVESTIGEGSLFWFEVPFAPGDAVNLPVAAARKSAPVVPRRILLAEDVEINRDLIRTVLERDGHEVTIVCDGRQAVEAARKGDFDLILMDVHMPVLDGLDATREIRAASGPGARIPIVALTANVMASEQTKCRAAGMDAVLMKPIDWEQVRVAIRKFTATANMPATPVGQGEAAPFDEASFSALSVAIGDRLDDHAARLGVEVRALCDARCTQDGSAIAEAAHRIVSQAGMFGLSRIMSRAERVEQAALAGEGVESALDDFRQAAPDFDIYLAPRLTALQD